MANKQKSLSEVVSWLSDGAHLSFGGFAHSLAPMAFVREMIRQNIKDLEISALGEAWAVDMLSAVGAIKKVRMSNFMFEGWGRCQNFSRAVEKGEIEVEDYSHFGISNRFFAGSIGVPFVPSKSMNGTDITNIVRFDKGQKFKEYECPFTGEKVLLIPSVRPDFAIIHASRADQNGNVQLFGISSSSEVIAKAAKKVIVTVEEIVDEDVIRQEPAYTMLPGFLVDAVVHVPYGAHPAGMYKYYDFDKDHIDHYIKASRSESQLSEYLNEYILSSKDHMDYLEKIGIQKLLDLRADPYYGYSLKTRGELPC
ncbi:CoA transferase subunit A [Bacillus litorisediminis]|uniref:CoA transferase subunit A n=1 Tax=Bacillus litorisediminis TaxID=2922713 RepID=UPI001FAE3E9A|nr:CoA-transferase [Bacillus litorisediminis]